MFYLKGYYVALGKKAQNSNIYENKNSLFI